MLIVDAFENVFQRRTEVLLMLDVVKTGTIHTYFIWCIV